MFTYIRRNILHHYHYSDEAIAMAEAVRREIASGYDPREDPESPYYDPDFQPSKNPKPSGVDYGRTKYMLVEKNTYLIGRERMRERGLNLDRLDKVIKMLLNGKKPRGAHKLDGDMEGIWDCHIKGGKMSSDWVLLYSYDHDKLILHAVNTGTHKECGIE